MAYLILRERGAEGRLFQIGRGEAAIPVPVEACKEIRQVPVRAGRSHGRDGRRGGRGGGGGVGGASVNRRARVRIERIAEEGNKAVKIYAVVARPRDRADAEGNALELLLREHHPHRGEQRTQLRPRERACTLGVRRVEQRAHRAQLAGQQR